MVPERFIKVLQKSQLIIFMDLKTVIKKLFLSLISLSLLTSCNVNNIEHIVVDNGNGQYTLVKDINEYYGALEIKGDNIVFSIDDITVNKNDTYTYKNIDVNEFWDYIVKKQQLDVENKPLLLTGIRYLDTHPIGAQLIYVLDNADNWLVYSYSSIIKKNNEYYSFNYQENNQIIDQNFDNIMPPFAEIYYNKYQWPIEKFEEWFELNEFKKGNQK